ncbi:MAG: C1 family peptidase [Bacteroidota bacterium]
MKIINAILLLIITGLSVNAQQGAITPEMLKEIKKTYKSDDPSCRAITNAMTNNEIKNLALNRVTAGKTDHFFRYRVDVKGITDQQSSGRCWMFTGLNILRPKAMKTFNIESFEFSENYLFFWDQFEKANLFLQAVIDYGSKPMDDRTVEWLFKNPVSDGGVWSSLTNLLEKYGAVPKEQMPETKNSDNTGWMNRMISRKLREDGLILRDLVAAKTSNDNIQARKIEMLGEIYKMLAYNFGEPPAEFTWRYKDKDGKISAWKKYTPQDFFKEACPDVSLDEYVMLMNDPSREYYKLYEIEYDRNVMEGRNWLFINLPSDEIKKYALESIKNNEAMYASCDVGKQLNKDDGVLATDNYDFESLYGVKFGMNKRDRIRTFESGSSHGMALIAVDTDENDKPVKWQFENSWGAASGHNGYLTFTDKWFDEYMFRVVVLKKFVDAKTLEVLKQKPVVLPPWDPMFLMDE